MDAALLTMVTALFAAVLASALDQRREGAKTRDKLDENNRTVRDLAVKVVNLSAQVDVLDAGQQHLAQGLADHRRLTDKNHAEVTGSLADARERLARIEGHLGIGLPPPNTADS
ncbi:MAG: hypothetical protein J4F50_00610 [Acidimicrobiia bacterium]|nr:hypothetical protein [Acidimicrobiia bacterium]